MIPKGAFARRARCALPFGAMQRGPSMPTGQPNLWGASDAYEQWMGRWSRKVAPLFIDWIDAPRPERAGSTSDAERGVPTAALLERCEPSGIVGIDSSAGFLEAARHRVGDPRVSFKLGDAQAVSENGGQFDLAVSGLVLNFVPDKVAMIRRWPGSSGREVPSPSMSGTMPGTCR